LKFSIENATKRVAAVYRKSEASTPKTELKEEITFYGGKNSLRRVL
jgi:hypothetical protein